MRLKLFLLSCTSTIAFAALVQAALPTTISQAGKVFTPNEITVPRGATLNIGNDDRVMHHLYIESDRMTFDSGEQSPGRTVGIAFAHAGVYQVLCAIHPKMVLTVRVE